jgi:hypothetical protein
VELWDVGGSPGHRQVRSMFYCNIHGMPQKNEYSTKVADGAIFSVPVGISFVVFLASDAARKHTFAHTSSMRCHRTGIVLVHDLTNRKSYNNLDKWANEILDVLSGRCMLRSS